MSDNKPYDHREEFTKYSEATPLDRDQMALNAFRTIERLEDEVEKAMDKIRKLQVES